MQGKGIPSKILFKPVMREKCPSVQTRGVREGIRDNFIGDVGRGGEGDGRGDGGNKDGTVVLSWRRHPGEGRKFQVKSERSRQRL